MTDKEYLEKTGQIIDPESGEVLAEIIGSTVRLSPGWTLKSIIECINHIHTQLGIALLLEYN